MRARRQNNSCDQCKRSKKACDGYYINNGEGLGFPLERDPQHGVLPCSYCVRTKKRCSLNLHWVARSATSPSSTLTDLRGDLSLSSEQERIDNNGNLIPSNASGTLGLLQTPSPDHSALEWDAPLPSLEAALCADDTLHPWGNEFGLDIDLDAGAQIFMLEKSGVSTTYLPEEEEYNSSQSYHDSTSQATDFSHLTTMSGTTPSTSMAINHGDLMQSTYRRRNTMRKNYRTRQRNDSWPEQLVTPVSPNYISQGPIASFNNHLITESLLQIFHDVLENNLACWLAEDTCPYKMQPKRSQLRPYSDATVQISETIPDTVELDPIRPNSMYRRVKQLDRAAQSTGLVQLTFAEDQAAAKALNLVIMAFASQWAQGHRRREKMFSVPLGAPDQARLENTADDFQDEFEQSFQHSLWEQAKKALQDVTDLESYRIVYAELVFGLIQRPWATYTYHGTSIPRDSENSSTRSIKASLPQIMEIISQDGPPVYTERAGRKMQALKFRFEANETGSLGSCYAFASRQREDVVSKMTAEERLTIGLLYWLAVMIDTVSSSMNERPVALADEDCQHDGNYSSSATVDRPTNYRWNLELFAQDDPANPSTLSWPCPYDLAAKAVNRSAPVKVLLFRYVSYLQNTLRKQERGPIIEEIIENTIHIYKYWNVTHGAFFRSLIQNYDSIPVRIKSWFVCIHIPWHLAALMLADLIEFVDQNGLGTGEASLNRVKVGLATRIRKSSAVELSDLARVTTPQEIGNMPTEQLPGFHFAVNEGSILTEPWTVLLIRAFTKASVFHLSAAEDLRRQERAILGRESEEYKESLRRCDTCVKALWFLGRKSEMARRLSKILVDVLRSQEAEMFN